MKLFKAFLTVTIVAAGFQAMAYTKGQKVFALSKSRYEKNNPAQDFANPYEVIDVDGDNVIAYRRDVGTRTLDKSDVYSEKKSLDKWWLDETREEQTKAKLPAITKGTVLLTYTWNSQKTGQPEPRKVSRIFESGAYGYTILIFEDGTYQSGVENSYVVDNPKTGLQGLPDDPESARIGDVVVPYDVLQQWITEYEYKEINTRLVEKVPAAKISALAFKMEYGNVIALAQVGNQWVDVYHVRPLVNSAYGVKTGDLVYTEYQRFDLRVEQIFRGTYDPYTRETAYEVILTGGERVFLTRSKAKELLSARVCKGDGAKHDNICKQYRDHLEELKNMSTLFECKFGDKVIKLDLKKKTMSYPGGKVSQGRSVTTDIFEWIAEVPASDMNENGNTVKARVRLDYNKFNDLYFVLNKKMDNQISASCMPTE